MRTLLVLTFMVFMAIPESFGQFLRIDLMNGPNLCCGYNDVNQACVHIKSTPPLSISEHTALVYTWYAKHEKGLKIWHTPIAGRWVPLPWSGTYEVWVVMQYVDVRTRYAFAAFKSNAVVIQAHNCQAPTTPGGETGE